MKTMRNQLLLKLDHFLSGRLGRREIAVWAAGQLPTARKAAPASGQSGFEIIAEVLSALSALPDERTRQYALVRENLNVYRGLLERAAATGRS